MGSKPPEMYTRQSLARLMIAPEVTVLTTFDPAISTAIGFVPVVEWPPDWVSQAANVVVWT